MEINHYGDTIQGVIASTNLVEGRMICLTSHTFDNDYGSDVDVPGAKYASSDAEKTRARYVITWAQDNRQTPLYNPGRAAPGTHPHFDNALRYGWDHAANAPFSTTVYLTHPGQQECLTIPSGAQALAFGEGVYTVPSGCYTYSVTLRTPGTQLQVGASGKLEAYTAGAVGVVAEVIRFHTTDAKLTFKILH